MKKNVFILFSFLLLANCSTKNLFDDKPLAEEKGQPGLFSKDSEKGLSITDLLSSKDKDNVNTNVNGYLWRASLNILSIVPLASTDALGGTIITDWYINENIKNQRIKISSFVKTAELRSDGIEVKVYIQNFKNNSWIETLTNDKLANQIEESILNEARTLRINSGN